VVEERSVAAETGKGSEERGEELFVVRIDLGSPFALVVGIGWVAVGSPAVEIEIQIAAVHNPSVVMKIRELLGILSVGTSENRDAVRGNLWVGEVFPRQNRAAFED
jgi:hypothetical protein